jgi:hypothetical protein
MKELKRVPRVEGNRREFASWRVGKELKKAEESAKE